MADDYATVHEHDLVGGNTRACIDYSIEIEMVIDIGDFINGWME
jgi:hypothetical protein